MCIYIYIYVCVYVFVYVYTQFVCAYWYIHVELSTYCPKQVPEHALPNLVGDAVEPIEQFSELRVAETLNSMGRDEVSYPMS